jgi:AhpD family alkylhydroperoxidase
MTTRLNLFSVSPKVLEPLLAIEEHIKASSLEPLLTHLVKIRASQINGCAYCLHMHTHDTRAMGEREERIYLLDAWRESKLYTPRERAALAWTEALTRVADTHAPDEDYEAAAAQFSPTELVDLTLLITNINAWNRLSVGFRNEHPRDKPQRVAA